MKYTLALVAAYLVTGAAYVSRKLTENNLLRVPLNVMKYRREGGTGRLFALVFSWPAGAILNKEFAYWLMFAALVVFGLYAAST